MDKILKKNRTTRTTHIIEKMGNTKKEEIPKNGNRKNIEKISQ